jgi:hypothetical protein
MAFVDHLDGSELSLDDDFDGHFFNVNMAVGPGAANRWDDVELVQYLLKRIYGSPLSFHPPFHPPEGDMIKIDGRFGRTTAKWINHFQREVNDQGGVPIRLDGRVDKSDSGGVSSISRTVYTIIALNKGLQLVDPEAFNNPAVDTECPPALCSRLGELVIDVNGPAPE